MATIKVQDEFTVITSTDLVVWIPTTAGDGYTEEFSDTTGSDPIARADGVLAATVLTGDQNAAIIISAQPNPGNNEYDLEGEIQRNDDEEPDTFWLLGRMTATNNFYSCGGNGHINVKLRLYKEVLGTTTLLDTSTTNAIDTGDALKFEIRDAAKKGYLNAVEEVSTDDNVITANGKWGIAWGNIHAGRSGDDIGTGWRFDNLIFTEEDAAAGGVVRSLAASGGLAGMGGLAGQGGGLAA